MSLPRRPAGVLRTAALIGLAGLIGMQTGCTSVLTTASLRDLVWKTPEHAAEGDPATATGTDTKSGQTSGSLGEGTDTGAGAQSDAGRRTAAIEEAVERLARLGRLDAATEATLVETLQRTQPEDWPVVVEAFAAALPPPEPAARAEVTDSTDAPAPESATADAAPETTTVRAAKPAAAETAVPTSVPATPPAAPEPPAEPLAASQPISFTAVPRSADTGVAEPRPALRLQNACFASRVRGWGDVDRFSGQRFEAGQEVIVYFELDGLAATETAAGCTTRIDTVLALLGPDGERLHSWRFDPLEETCKQRRRDYFARYLVVLPANAVGRCRLEVSVSDAVAAQSAGATLPLDIAPAAPPR